MIRKLLIVLLLMLVAAAGSVYFLLGRHPNNRIPPAALHALESDSNLVLYSLYPTPYDDRSGELKPIPDTEPKFHDYRILGQSVLKSSESRRVVVKTLRDAVRNWDGQEVLCFMPRHGIRATDPSGTYDFLICFGCEQVSVFMPGNKAKGLGVTASGRPLNDILTAAHVPLPDR